MFKQTPMGRLNQRVAIQAPVETQAVDGSVSVTYETIATVWASVEPLRGEERFAAQQVSPRVSHRVRMRYYAGLTSRHRLLLLNAG